MKNRGMMALLDNDGKLTLDYLIALILGWKSCPWGFFKFSFC